MVEWLDSKVLKRWFWQRIWINFDEWLRDTPIVVKTIFWTTTALFVWLLFLGHFSGAIEHVAAPTSFVRGTGVSLQLFGFILAAYGLERALEKFGQTPSTSRVLPWLFEFPSIFDTTRTVIVSPEPVKAEVSGNASLTVNRGIRPPQSNAERIRKLEQKFSDLRGEIRDVREDLEEEAERLEERIEEEVEAVEQEVQKMREKVKEVNVGERARWLEWSGVSFFVYGVPLASFPSSFLPAYRILIIPVVAGTLLGSLHWYAD
jgi:hypothetical protein